MFSTYQMMKQYDSKDLDSLDLNDIVKIFQLEENRNKKSKLYASIFCRLFPMMLKNQKTFFNIISNEDRVEICLCVLLDAIKNYKNKKIKFSTYFCTCLKNRLLTHKTQMNASKRKVWLNVIQENDKTKFILNSLPSQTESTKQIKLLNDIKNTEILSSTEKEYCACLIAGYTKTKDINHKLNLAGRIKNINVDNPIYERVNNRLCNQVRVRLKNKLKNNIIEIIK